MDDTHAPAADAEASADPQQLNAVRAPGPGSGLEELAAVDAADAPPIAERLAEDLSAELDASAASAAVETATGQQETT